MWEGGGWAGWSGVWGGKWDNCNSIINKYIKKKKNSKKKKKKNEKQKVANCFMKKKPVFRGQNSRREITIGLRV